MNDETPPNTNKLDLAQIAQRQDVLRDGLQDFLDDNKLHLSDQNFDRAFQHLLSATSHFETLTLFDVQNYLQQILEYHEHVIETMNRTGLAEESLIKLIITADKEQDPQSQNNINKKDSTVEQNNAVRWKFGITSLPLPIAVSLFLIACFAVATPFIPNTLLPHSAVSQDAYNEIGASSIEELKELVKQLESAEQAAGNDTTTVQIWNDIKALDEVTKHGYKSSYKNFTPEQWEAAKVYLEQRISELNK